MDGKETARKIWTKIGFGILFVAACFIAMYILMEFHGEILIVAIAAVLLLISAFLFLNAVFSDKAKSWIPQEEPEEQEVAKEILSGNGDGEFRLKIAKHMKAMENTQKELIDVLKTQNTLIQSQIENLEHEIYMLSEKQANQTKSIIKFNKENARQMAISERETLEYVMMELKKVIEDNAGAAVVTESPEEEIPAAVFEEESVAEMFAEEPIAEAPVMEEVSEVELFEVSDLVTDEEEYGMPDLTEEEPETMVEEVILPEEPVEEAELPEEPVEEAELPEEPIVEEIEIPDMPEDIDLSELFDIPELYEDTAEEARVEPEPVIEEAAPVVEETAEEQAPAADPLAGLSGDPNAMMTPEDIAKLLASMGQ